MGKRSTTKARTNMAAQDRPIDPHKSAVVEYAFSAYDVRSFVDLGACWGVNGGYTFHGLEIQDIERAVIVDGRVTDLTRERATGFPQLELIEAPLGEQQTVDLVGEVDAAIMFDILLHQVNPDWTEFLARYAVGIDTLVIHNQCWRGPETIRFPDLPLEENLRRVYHHDREGVAAWYGRHDEVHDGQQRPWRDVHNFWQWGITAKDLIGTLWDLGYRIDAFQNSGLFSPEFKEIEMLSIVARRRDLP